MNNILTLNDILNKSKFKNIIEIKNINFWGLNLENIDIISELPNLESAAFSINKINSLKSFINCKNLKELFIRKNNISSLIDIKYLIPLKKLKILWLTDNPITNIKDYRKKIIYLLPQLEKLDEIDITNEEKLLSKSFINDSPILKAIFDLIPLLNKNELENIYNLIN